MIVIITRWEITQMPKDLEHRMWRQIKGAFDVSQLFFVNDCEGMAHVLNNLPKKFTRVFLEPTGEKGVNEIPDGDIALILGNTEMHNLKFSDPSERYRIDTPKRTDLYGTNAAAIALACRYGQ